MQTRKVSVTEAALMADDPDQPAAGTMIPKGPPPAEPRPPRTPPPGMKPCPAPGVYPGVPFEEYTRWDGLNHSRLLAMGDCPEAFKYGEDHPEADDGSAAKGFGIACHTAIFEPELFRQTAALGPINEKTGKTYGRDSQAWAKFAAANPTRTLLESDEAAQIQAITGRLMADEDIAALLGRKDALREVVIVWDDELTGDRCKRRIDLAIPKWGFLDLKSTESANPKAFAKSVVNYHYHTADAFTLRGIQTLKRKGLLDWREHSVLLAVGKHAPHTPALYTLSDDLVAIGMAEVKRWLQGVRDCRDANDWPGYMPNPTAEKRSRILTIEAPTWYLKQFSDDEER